MKKLIAFAAVVAVVATFGIVQLSSNASNASPRDYDGNAIIYGGAYSKGEFTKKLKQDKHKDLKKIYARYNVPTSLAGAKNGKVTKSGNVYVGSKLVATKAASVGRHNFGKSSTINLGGGKKIYQRSTSTSFVGSEIPAYVFLDKNGKFISAMLKSCANPVTAVPKKPKPTPTAACDGLSASKINRTKFKFTAKASVKNGAKIHGYRIDFGDGHAKYYKTGAKSKTVEHTYAKPGNYKVKMTVNTTVGKYITSSNCATTVKVEQPPKPTPKPAATCDGLSASKIARNEYKFTASASVKNGAKIKDYTFDFGNGSTKTTKSNTITHKFDSNFASLALATVKVTVNTTAGNKTSANCETKVEITPPPVKPLPAASCDALETTKADRTEYTFAVTASAHNGATIKDYTFNFGDGQTKTTTSKEVAHTYAKSGTYKVTVTANTSLGEKTSADCATEVTVQPHNIEVCDLTTKEIVTINEEDFDSAKHSKNLEDCKETPVTHIKVCDKEDNKIVTINENDFDDSRYTKNLDDCKTEETPAELPETGVGSGISAALGLGSVATAISYYVASRRNLLSTLLGR